MEGPGRSDGERSAAPDLPRSRKATYRLGELVRDVAAVAARSDAAVAIWAGRRVDPAERERVMAVVARANECRWCSFVHRTWARAAGVEGDDLDAAVGLHWERFDPTRQAGLAWSWARSLSGFGDVPRSVAQPAHDLLEARERADLDLVARVMTVANRSGNSLDAVLERASGRARPRLQAGELVAGVAFGAAIPPALAVLSLLRRRAPWTIARDFFEFSGAFAREVAGQSSPAHVAI